MATYNGEKYILEQLHSILSQIGTEDEVLISDDGSTDGTLHLITQLGDARIKVISNTGRNGCIYNFENALKNAQGDFIFLADQDDVWAPDKVKIFMKALSKSDMVISDAKVTDSQMNVIEDSFYFINKNHQGKLYNLFVSNHYLGCCMAFHKKILQIALPFPSCIPMHDIWLGNVAAFGYSVLFIPEKLTFYRRHGENASTTSGASKYSLLEKFLIRWHILAPLFVRFIKKRDR